jgi:cyclopropane fatty-acyl-phospholipid synthase-like methyltransferase
MGDGADQGGATSSLTDRVGWLFELRRENERQEDALQTLDAYWTETDDAHLSAVDRFLSMLPAGGSVLDAACGIGRYVGTVLASGRSVTAVDASARHLDAVRTSFPDATTEQHDLQDLPYRDRFDGVMCVDAMEFIPPEDWPGVLARFRDAMRANGRLYLTVELVPAEQIRSLNDAARRAGLPVVDGELMWEMSDQSPGYYHYYPSLEQVRVWMAAAGFRIVDEVEGPWVDGEYAYHHVVAQTSGEAER